MIAGGIFTENAVFDWTVVSIILGMFATIVGMLRDQKNSRAAEIRTVIEAVLNERSQESATGKVEIHPTPLTVQEAERFTSRKSFEVHAQLNREAHEKIEREIGEQLHRLETSHNALAREVSELNATVELNGNRLESMDRKLDTIRFEIRKS